MSNIDWKLSASDSINLGNFRRSHYQHGRAIAALAQTELRRTVQFLAEHCVMEHSL